MKLKDYASKLSAEYVSAVVDGKVVTYYSKSSVNADAEVPKGVKVQYKAKNGKWQTEK